MEWPKYGPQNWFRIGVEDQACARRGGIQKEIKRALRERGSQKMNGDGYNRSRKMRADAGRQEFATIRGAPNSWPIAKKKLQTGTAHTARHAQGVRPNAIPGMNTISRNGITKPRPHTFADLSPNRE